jgi:uncharacterized damage-inducible protein DinB
MDAYRVVMRDAAEVELPPGGIEEREMLLAWLAYLRGAVLRKLDGLTDEQAHWRPDGQLISVLGIVNHLTHVEWRWIDGGFTGAVVSRSEGEFDPGLELTVATARAAYVERAASTESTVRSLPTLETPCARWPERRTDLRWVLLHLINETARHAGHADAVRELLDGSTGD